MASDTKSNITRDPLALAMLAAWLNVTVEQLPGAFRAHTCTDTMTAWKRVGDAAIQYLKDNPNA